MEQRFSVRADGPGYSVWDREAGEPAVIAGMTQTGLSRDDADHTAALLNSRNETAGRGAAELAEAADRARGRRGASLPARRNSRPGRSGA
ncbi:MAG TPA: hypothetical protein VLI41_06700 [Phenylobacterium sp.]|uniref:hypothetical protein n=1 Tax=Phenylobacterium sp. TaxID=1871053 RepID=UPI002BBA1EFD|nr:hypothetical protein [Phenylobacterium sp.]HSV02879.1 hypothetical protein [Phenylobacterium sp.]